MKMKLLCFLSIMIALLAGCSTAMQKPDIGPTGAPTKATTNPPLMQRFEPAPASLYDLEEIAGSTFEGINKEDWGQAEQGFNNLSLVWSQTKTLVGDKKGVKDADESLSKLQSNINTKKITGSYENLNAFMASISEIGKSYKLSPVSDIISISNNLRNVSFYVEDKNWTKSQSKVKELQDNWNQAKPVTEQVGILSETTKTHSYINQLKDAVNAENEPACKNILENLNESMGKIRQFFRGK